MTPSSFHHRDVNALRGNARELTRRYQAGGQASLRAFEKLVRLMLRVTVLRPDGVIRLHYSKQRDEATLGGASGPKDPLPLNDGRLLRLSIRLFLAGDDSRGPLLKVRASSFQYQLDLDGEQWIFRYDYQRELGIHGHPQAHLQLRGELKERKVLAERRALERVHFPTGRMALEGVIRLLVEQFGVPCRQPAAVWRPVLAEAERAFLEIAHRPLSGPAA